jgi:hypothetical protein
MSECEVGEAFYTELGEAAPDMARLFARPKSLQVLPRPFMRLLVRALGRSASVIPPFLLDLAYWPSSHYQLRRGVRQAKLFMRRMDMLVAVADDPAALFEDTRALSVRHVKVCGLEL